MSSDERIGSLRAGALGALLVIVLALWAPLSIAGAAAAGTFEGGNSFSELSRKAEEASVETTPTTTTPAGTINNSQPTNSSKTLVIVLGAAVVLLSGIAFVIVRDARRVAPAGETDLIASRTGGVDRTTRQRKRRARAKAARAQRKRNR